MKYTTMNKVANNIEMALNTIYISAVECLQNLVKELHLKAHYMIDAFGNI